jgi:hypothetical protein
MERQNDHVLIDWRWHSVTLGFQPFRGYHNTDQYLVVEKVGERLQ